MSAECGGDISPLIAIKLLQHRDWVGRYRRQISGWLGRPISDDAPCWTSFYLLP